MSLRCKPGILAMLIRGKHAGVPVRVVFQHVEPHLPSGLLTDWAVDFGRPMQGYMGDIARYLVYPDSWLLPINGGEPDGDTTTWAGLPSDLKQPEHA